MRGAAVAAPQGARSPGGTAPPRGGALFLGVLIAELSLLALGFAIGDPLYAGALALSSAYFLLAFRSPDIAWALVWVAFPFSIEVTLPGGSAINLPTEPMIAMALAAWGLRLIWTGGFQVPRSPLHLPLAMLAGIALLSVALGAHQAAGLKAWLVAAAYAAFGYLYFLSSPCDATRRGRWIRMVVITAAVWGLYGSIRVLALGISPRMAYGIARPFFPEHGTYAAFLAMALPLAILYALDRRGAARLGYAAAAFLIALGITLSFTRAAWVSLVVVLPLAGVLWARRRGSWRSLVLPAVLAAMVAAIMFAAGATRNLSRHAESVGEVENVSNLERVNRWIAAWEMTKDHPLLGVGYGAYALAYPEYRRKLVVTEVSYLYMGPHSEPLRLLSETGIAGLAAALWFLAAAAGTGLRVFRSAADPGIRLLSLSIVAGLATYAIHGIFNSYLGYDKVTVPFWIGLGVIAALGAQFDDSPVHTRGPRRRARRGKQAAEAD